MNLSGLMLVVFTLLTQPLISRYVETQGEYQISDFIVPTITIGCWLVFRRTFIQAKSIKNIIYSTLCISLVMLISLKDLIAYYSIPSIFIENQMLFISFMVVIFIEFFLDINNFQNNSVSNQQAIVHNAKYQCFLSDNYLEIISKAEFIYNDVLYNSSNLLHCANIIGSNGGIMVKGYNSEFFMLNEKSTARHITESEAKNYLMNNVALYRSVFGSNKKDETDM